MGGVREERDRELPWRWRRRRRRRRVVVVAQEEESAGATLHCCGCGWYLLMGASCVILHCHVGCALSPPLHWDKIF